MCLGSAPRRSGRAPAQRSRVRVTRHNGHRLRRPHVTPARRATSLRREAVHPSLTTERHPTLLATAARPRLHRTLAGADVTVIVPAYNEAASVADTIRSLQAQTERPFEIIVVDDCSTDGTGDLARALGVTVVRPPHNTGSKAGAQSYGLRRVRTPLTVAIDADTVLARSEEHTSELQSPCNLVCRLLLEKKNNKYRRNRAVPEAPSTMPGRLVGGRKSPADPGRAHDHRTAAVRSRPHRPYSPAIAPGPVT